MVELLGYDDDVGGTSIGSAASTSTGIGQPSPPKKRRRLFTAYAKHFTQDVIPVKPSVASVVALYVDNLPTLNAQALKSEKYWDLFRIDMHFKQLRKVLEKIMCVPATSAPVERIFSHGGLFMRRHRARLGPNVLADLVFSECNMHCKYAK